MSVSLGCGISNLHLTERLESFELYLEFQANIGSISQREIPEHRNQNQINENVIGKDLLTKIRFISLYSYNPFDGLSEFKIISLKNDLNFFITLGSVSLRYSTPACVRFSCKGLTLARSSHRRRSIKNVL